MGQEILSISSINTNSVPTVASPKTAKKVTDIDLPNLLSKSSNDIKTDEPLTDKAKSDLLNNNKSWLIGGGLALGTIVLAILTRGKFKPKEVLPPNVLKMPNGQKIVTDIALNNETCKKTFTLKLLTKFFDFIDDCNKKTIIKKFKNAAIYKGKIKFKHFKTVEEAQKFAKENLDIIKITFSENDNPKAVLKQINYILRIFSKIHNKTKGKIIFPKQISLNGNTMKRWGKLLSGGNPNALGGASIGNHFIAMHNNDNVYTRIGLKKLHALLHELGHINHQFRTNYRNIASPFQVECFGKSKNITNEFLGNMKLQCLIQEKLGWYACTSPAEFVAEMFAGLMRGKKYPPELMERYHMYKGPTNYRFMFK